MTGHSRWEDVKRAYEARVAANALVNRYVLRKYREELPSKGAWWGPDIHLHNCPEATADASPEDGVYGCETGCEYMRFTATVSCSHGRSEEYHFGTFGKLSDLIEDLTSEEG